MVQDQGDGPVTPPGAGYVLNRTQTLSELRTQLEDCGFMQVGESPGKDKIVILDIFIYPSQKTKEKDLEST